MRKELAASVMLVCLATGCSEGIDYAQRADAAAEVESTDSGVVEAEEETEFSANLKPVFRERFVTNFVGSCVSEAVKAGATDETIRPICECSAEELLKRMESLAETVNPPEDKVMAAAEYCLTS